MAQSPAALRIVTNRRQDFDTYFPVEEYEPSSQLYDNDLASLPFPAPLASLRASFRGDEFECDAFLLEHQKHGQLDDLLLELRGLSGMLENELVKGVEEDYEAFIGLGRMDSKKVDELSQGVTQVAEKIKSIEAEVQENLREIEETLAARRDLRQKKKQVRKLINISMGVDELAFLMEDKTDLEPAVESFEHISVMTKRTEIPEYDQARYQDLKEALKSALMDTIKKTKGAAKLEVAELLRRYEKASSTHQ